MRIPLLIEIFLLYFGSTMAVDLKSIPESIDKTLEIIHAVREIYSHHEVLFQKVAPEVYKAFHNFAKEYDHDMSHILLQDLEEDYEQVSFLYDYKCTTIRFRTLKYLRTHCSIQ